MYELKNIDEEAQKEAQLYRIRKAAEYLSLEELTLIAQTAYGAACMAKIKEEYQKNKQAEKANLPDMEKLSAQVTDGPLTDEERINISKEAFSMGMKKGLQDNK